MDCLASRSFNDFAMHSGLLSLWCTSLVNELVQNADYILARQTARALGGEVVSGEFVHHGQKPKATAVDGLVVHKVVAPDVIRMCSPVNPLRRLPKNTPLLVVFPNLQTFAPTNETHPFAADWQPVSVDPIVDPPVGIAL